MRFNSRVLRTIVTAACLAAAAGFATGATADTQTDKVGNPGGTPFTAQCPSGNALVGLAYNYGNEMLAIGALCQPIEGKELTGERDANPRNVYGLSGSQSQAYFCKPDYGEVRSLNISLNDKGYVHHLRVICAKVGGGHGSSTSGATATLNPTASTTPSGVGCPQPNSYATGFVGAYSTYGIRNLGLICHDVRDDQAADTSGDDADQDTANADTGDQGDGDNSITIDGFPFQIEVNIGPDQGGINFGPKGKTRTVRDGGTTVYADKGSTELGSLDKGAKVLTIGCEKGGKGWCQIAKPIPGLVWGGDLK
jgi:hypothetical protein